MRIISGIYKSRRIKPPSSLSLRPTTDAGKETLFNILANYFSFPEISFLDLFAGTGNITYEAASRGCTDIESIDDNFKCIGFIKSTVSDLEMSGVRAIKNDAFQFLENTRRTYDVIFADPPYGSQDIVRIHEIVFDRNLLKKGGFLILEHGNDQAFSELAHFKDERAVGNVNFSIFDQMVSNL